MFDQFKNELKLDEEHWNDYINCFKRIEVPAETVLLKDGQISKRLYLIEKGCIRSWFNNNGKTNGNYNINKTATNKSIANSGIKLLCIPINLVLTKGTLLNIRINFKSLNNNELGLRSGIYRLLTKRLSQSGISKTR